MLEYNIYLSTFLFILLFYSIKKPFSLLSDNAASKDGNHIKSFQISDCKHALALLQWAYSWTQIIEGIDAWSVIHNPDIEGKLVTFLNFQAYLCLDLISSRIDVQNKSNPFQ